MINPEFQRNFWLELTAHRLIAVPLICALFLFLALALQDWTLNKETGAGALWLFVLFSGVFGTKKASAAIFDEVLGHTWDWQRMSGLNPWAMTWGKLFGKTLLYWYLGLFALVVAFIGFYQDQADIIWWYWYLLALLGVLFSQALGFFFNFIHIRRRAQESPERMSSSLYLLVLFGVFGLFIFLSDIKQGQVSWFAWQFNTLVFAILSILCFWLWTLVGAYRLMRRELNHSAHPWVWLGFLAFCALYIVGFIHQSRTDSLLIVFLTWQSLTLLSIFLDTKDPVALRGLFASLRKGDLAKALQLIPAWLSAMLLTSLALLLLMLLPERIPDLSWLLMGMHPDFSIASLALLFWLFLVRDCALILSLGLSGEAQRAEATALVYLLLLYLVMPALLKSLHWSHLIPFFLPRADLSLNHAMTGAVIGALVGLGLLIRQWYGVGRQPSKI